MTHPSAAEPAAGAFKTTAYVFNFAVILDNQMRLLHGAAQTLALSAESMVCGLMIAILCVLGKMNGGRALGRLIDFYIELIRNTPLIVQLFIIYFGLPELGIRIDADVAAVIGMSINLGAYATEILRAGVESIPSTQLDAGRALGLRPLQIFRLIIFVPALRAIFPALASQFVMIMLGSSAVSTISAEELTSTANALQSETFRPFEIYFAATVIYVLMAFGFRAAFAAAGRRWLGRWPA